MATPILTHTPTFTPALRINRSLTASAEKRLLEFLARHTPRAITSDHLTLLGLSAQIAAGLFYALSRYAPARTPRRQRLHPPQLARRLARRHARPRPPPAAPALRLLRRPHHRSLRRHRAPRRPRPLRLRTLARRARHAHRLPSSLRRKLPRHPHPRALRALTIPLRPHRAPHPPHPRQPLPRSATPTPTSFGHHILLFDLGGSIGALCMFALVVTLAIRHTAQLFREEPLPRA